MTRTALYPGSFDPLTNGHLDILERAVRMFDKVIVTVAVNKRKNAVFTGDERVDLIKEAIGSYDWADNVEVEQFTGLLIDFARKKNVHVLLRGVRQISDFEYEFRMALTNRRLAPEVDTIFMMPDEQLTFISATIVKEVAEWGGDLSSFVPANVARALHAKFSSNS
ncbi:pantetheine-phosphate adenylyltransferase [Rhodohalobacter mucosus]|uniref:Phosphopantetheine adenylyltransferase n=1 Tax=Rhodohalobacter mucosus TaxID=2079485 RepID=A0A316TRB8_9BACT|nr:pantetheine-phosphate adenylyltransferase [Rhodohalobacter mucosus]PWN05575.1 pantetheine-phosphate adenylyltransferase [Rhodohalobacter mucosus]